MCYLWDDKWTQRLPALWNRQGLPVFGVRSSQPQARRDMLFPWPLILQPQPRWSGLCRGRWHLFATFLGWVLLFCPALGQPRLKLGLLLLAEKGCLGDFSLEHPQPCMLWAPLVWGSSPSLSWIAMLDF